MFFYLHLDLYSLEDQTLQMINENTLSLPLNLDYGE